MDPWAKISGLSKSDICNRQNKKLHIFINEYLYPFSPHYKQLFDHNKIDPRSIRTVDDLRRIPFTSKLDFVQEDQPDKYRDFIMQPDVEKIKKNWSLPKKLKFAFIAAARGKTWIRDQLEWEFRPAFMTFTTGTTNRPVPFLYANHDMQNLRTSGARMLNLFGIESTDRIVNVFPYAPHLAFWQVVSGGLESNVLCFSTGGGKVMGTEGNITILEKIKPSVILGVPSYIYHLLKVALERKTDLSFVKKIVLGASKVTIPFKQKLAELLEQMGARDVSVFGTYGFTEARCAWAEAPTPLDVSSGYFLYPDKEIFEIVDPETGEPRGEGEDGEIVYTSLDARASVVLRYRTGDFVKGGIVYEKSPYSNVHVPRLSSDITRLSNVKDLQLSKIKGTLVNLNHFYTVMDNIAIIDDWQLEIKKKNDDPFDVDEFVIHVCVLKECSQEDLSQNIKKKICEATEVAPNAVHFVSRAEMVNRLQLETANKERRIVDNRPKE